MARSTLSRNRIISKSTLLMFDDKAYHKEYYKKNKHKWQATQREKYLENRDEILRRRKEMRASRSEEEKERQALYMKEWRKRNKDKMLGYRKRPEVRYEYYYKRASSRRGYSFELTFDDYKTIIEKPCYLCGTINAVGIDRMDNSIGYTLENSRPCCEMCNRMKWAFGLEEFNQHVKKIYEHIK